ncbi:MAG: bifunctional phosphoribosylaminoimidazolecarboxamide formyltransferase/IMP cyclohydrolase, partial [Caldisericia bacterium]|nr:bifunctional phosphoribosylaminoimidazolecarboxamide formyltransferase/IMP cyclohydrolase [Caldisericia bacterium]
MITIKRALISVSSKEHLLNLANILTQYQVEIIATNRTYQYLTENQIPCVLLSDYTGYPEMIHGRVKTLHPKVFAGILARNQYGEMEEIASHGIRKFDLVCVNLYPFHEATQHSDNEEKWLDEIDIGGVSLLRASAKNYHECVTLSDPADYSGFIQVYSENNGSVPLEFSLTCMRNTFLRTSQYDAQIAKQFFNRENERLSVLYLQKNTELRYGENPHQKAALWTPYPPTSVYPMGLRFIHGKEMSYNNYLDVAMGLKLLDEFDRPASVIVKHNNPCGCAEADSLQTAYEQAYSCDPVSAYGGIFLFNRSVTETIAQHIHKHFAEVIVAPSFDEKALSILEQKKNVRLLVREEVLRPKQEIKSLHQSYLIQTPDSGILS